MVRFRAPANVQIRRAQIILLLVVLVPTILLIATGIVLLALGDDTPSLVAGILVLAFCTSSITGFILGSVFLNRGARIARFQNDFLSSVSHELRTPLTSIGMFIETLRDERLTDPARKTQCLDLLDQEVHRLQGLVERLLRLSHIESGEHGFARVPVCVADLIKESIAAFDAASIHDDTQIEVEQEEGLYVLGDAQALAQAITNLLVNAWKYSGAGPKKIGIQAVASSNYVELTVHDDGPGIPRSEQKQIFGQFQRGRSAIDSTKHGSGLGLAIVRAIIRAHKGRIELKSKPGQGSSFRIRLRAP